MSESVGSAELVHSDRHPTGLYVLFLTEMWERFSYYGMRTVLIYYMIKQLMYAQERASHIYGLYTAFVYLTPLIGGFVADRYFGQRKTVIFGGIVMAIGQFCLISESLFYTGLILLIIGNGAFKPNVSTQVGLLYKHGDHRRDRAYSIYYVGVNLGAWLAGIVCGWLGKNFGWTYGFGAAGVGMITGLIIYILGQKHLAPDNVMLKKAGTIAKEDKPLTGEDMSKIWGLVAICAMTIIFWAIYEQQGNTMALWADANTDRMILGWEMPAGWFQSFNPSMIFLFTPLITSLWRWQDKRGREPSSVGKMTIGCFILGISFLVMIPAAWSFNEAGKVSILWLAASTAILTIGELYLSPVGLSLVTKIAPAKLVSMMMGMWFVSSFFGNYLAGFLGMFWEKMPKEVYFLMLAALGFGAGLMMLAVLKPLKRAIAHGKERVDV